MKLIPKKYFLLALAAFLVVAMGYMSMTLSRGTKKNQMAQVDSYNKEVRDIEKQSSSDDINSIEKDLQETDLTEIEDDLQDIENELEQSY